MTEKEYFNNNKKNPENLSDSTGGRKFNLPKTFITFDLLSRFFHSYPGLQWQFKHSFASK